MIRSCHATEGPASSWLLATPGLAHGAFRSLTCRLCPRSSPRSAAIMFRDRRVANHPSARPAATLMSAKAQAVLSMAESPRPTTGPGTRLVLNTGLLSEYSKEMRREEKMEKIPQRSTRPAEAGMLPPAPTPKHAEAPTGTNGTTMTVGRGRRWRRRISQSQDSSRASGTARDLLIPIPPNSYGDVLSSSAPECYCIWQQGLLKSSS